MKSVDDTDPAPTGDSQTDSPTDSPTEWSIDQLAALSDVPVRTIREYQRLGLLEPPRREGRRGRYGIDHRRRLSVIARLQERGYSLAAIGDLLESWHQGRGLGSILGVDADPTVLDEVPTLVASDAVGTWAPSLADPQRRELAFAAGLLHERGEQTHITSMAALEFVELMIGAGVAPSNAIGAIGSLITGVAEGARGVVGAVADLDLGQADAVSAFNPTSPLTPTLQRARLLLAQSAATVMVQQLGEVLLELAEADPRVARLRTELQIGAVRTLDPMPGTADKTAER